MKDFLNSLIPVIGKETVGLLNYQYERNLVNGIVTLPPPPTECLDGEIKIGYYKSSKGIFSFGLSHKEIQRHMIICGVSGSGKTNAAFKLLNEFQKHNIKFLITDWKKSHRKIIKRMKSVRVHTLASKDCTFHFNVLIPPKGVAPDTWALKLIDVFTQSHALLDGALYIMMKALHKIYLEFGVYGDKPPSPYPTLEDLYFELLNMKPTGFRASQWHASATRTIASLLYGNLFHTFVTQHNSEFLNENCILELHNLPNSNKIFITHALLLYTHQLRLNENNRGQLKNVFILEEAHNLVPPSNPYSEKAHDNIIEQSFRESRELGTSIILIAQHASLLPATAIGNSFSIIAMAQNSEKDTRVLADILLLDQKEKRFLSQLQTGEAIVKLGGRITKPFFIHIPKIDFGDDLPSDAEIKGHNAKLSVEKPLTGDMQPPESPKLASSRYSISQTEFAFLASIIKQPFLKTEERYRALGLSNYTADKTRNALLKKKLIHDILFKANEHTYCKISTLTETGKNLLKVIGLHISMPAGEGGLVHRFFINEIAQRLLQFGYEVRYEEHNVDIIARKNGKTIALEVETGASDIESNILKCCALPEVSKIYFAGTNEEVLLTLQKLSDKYPGKFRIIDALKLNGMELEDV